MFTLNYIQVPSEQTALKAGGGELHRISCVTFSLIKKKRNIVWVGCWCIKEKLCRALL